MDDNPSNERVVYLIGASNHSLTYEATTPAEVGRCVEEILRRLDPLIGIVTIEQRVLYPASALKGAPE